MNEFAKKLYSVRVAMGMSQYAFAKSLGVTRESYHHYEDGTRVPNVDFLRKFCEVYHIGANWMIGLDDETGKVDNVTDKTTNKAIREIETAMDACAAALDFLRVKYDPF